MELFDEKNIYKSEGGKLENFLYVIKTKQEKQESRYGTFTFTSFSGRFYVI